MDMKMLMVFLKSRTQKEAAKFIYGKENYNDINLQNFRETRDQLLDENLLKKVDDAERNARYRTNLDVERTEYAFLQAIEKSRFFVRSRDGRLHISGDLKREDLQAVLDDGIKNLVSDIQQSFEEET
jgi:hypothetical protein